MISLFVLILLVLQHNMILVEFRVLHRIFKYAIQNRNTRLSPRYMNCKGGKNALRNYCWQDLNSSGGHEQAKIPWRRRNVWNFRGAPAAAARVLFRLSHIPAIASAKILGIVIPHFIPRVRKISATPREL